jgi:ABC-type polysaccharide/polyol phosphate export permease
LRWNGAIRQIHRWLSIAFTAGVLIYIIAMTRGRPPGWLGVFPLLPLISLLATGLYLFVLPYATRVRGGRRPTR